MLADTRIGSSIALMALNVAVPFAVLAQEQPLDVRSLERFALTHAGDAERGRELFRREKVTRCLSCHRLGSEGGFAGPDLSAIGGKFDRPHLIESLLEPSKQMVEGYRSSVLALRDGRIITGVIRERSEQSVTLFDAEGRKQVIALREIEQRVDSNVSLMPEGLGKELSPGEFTDLIAYLETLRPGGKSNFGAGITGPITMPDDFEISVVATGLDGATALETLPDGRVLVCEQTGAVRVIENDKLLDAPFVTLPVDSSWERGVIGITIDPNFADDPFVFVCWVAKEPYPHHRVSRFRADGNVAAANSEHVLVVGDNQNTMGGKIPNGHQGGALHFGKDRCLYIAIGEQTAESPSQQLNTFLGKILRVNRDGSIPADNPFVELASGKYRAIWAYGCRNPFTFAVRQSDGFMLINDVGGKFEEINVGKSGANYGWPAVEHGPREAGAPFVGPVYWYPQASISGGDFSPVTGHYFFADFVHGWIKTLDPGHPERVKDFATGLRRPVDLRFARDGSLYVLLRNAWVIDDKFHGGTGSLLKIYQRGKETDARQSRAIRP